MARFVNFVKKPKAGGKSTRRLAIGKQSASNGLKAEKCGGEMPREVAIISPRRAGIAGGEVVGL